MPVLRVPAQISAVRTPWHRRPTAIPTARRRPVFLGACAGPSGSSPRASPEPCHCPEQPRQPGEGIEPGAAVRCAGRLFRQRRPFVARAPARAAPSSTVARAPPSVRHRRIGGGDAVARPALRQRALPGLADIPRRAAGERQRADELRQASIAARRGACFVSCVMSIPLLSGLRLSGRAGRPSMRAPSRNTSVTFVPAWSWTTGWYCSARRIM